MAFQIFEDEHELARIAAAEEIGASFAADGCWVILYEHVGYGGQQLRIAGPTEIPDLEVMDGNWHDKIDSIVVGPNAVCRLYHLSNYREGHISFLPGEKHNRLGHLGFHDAASSLKVYRASDLRPPY